MKFFEIHKYPSRKNFPVYGNINRLYIDLESNKFYYWEDGRYFKISTTELDQATYDDLNRTLGDTYETIVNSDNKLALKADKTYVDDIVDSLDGIAATTLVEVTWQELKDKRDAGELIPGQQYRITDYVTTTVQLNTQSAGHQFDIIVTADAVDKLNENARAAHKKVEEGGELLSWFEHDRSDYPERYFYKDSVVIEGLTLYRWLSHEESNNGDVSQYLLTEKRDVSIGDVVWGYQIIDDGNYASLEYEEGDGQLRTIINVGEGYMPELDYFANSKLEAWKLKYCLDNDTSRFAWADEVNGKGVIYRMIDEFNNDVPYDFKNIIYQTRPGFTYNQWGQEYTFTRDTGLDMIIADIQYYGYVGYRTPTAWSSNTCWLRDDPATTSSVVYDASGATTGYGNIIAVSNENYDVYTFSRTKTATQDFDVSLNGFLYSCYSNTIRPYVVEQAQVLNRITFVGWYAATSYPGLYCYNNTFGDNCHSNTFGNNCYANTFGNSCYANTFGTVCYNNTFGDNCHSNTFGNNCYANTFGNSCYANTFGTVCYNNTFGDNCHSNTFGNNCYANTFGNSCYANTFGTVCYNNTFGDYCQSNTFGTDCYNNTFGECYQSNTFGEYCQSNTFGNNCRYLRINNISATIKRNIYVDNGFNGASSANRFDLYDPAILNKDYQVTFKKSASGKYLMLWATDTGTMTGKVKDSNVDNTWEDIV